MTANVCFTVVYGSDSTTFSNLSEAMGHPMRGLIEHRVMEWSQSIRELGMRKWIADQLNSEVADRTEIEFWVQPLR